MAVTGDRWTWVLGIAGLGEPGSDAPACVGLSTHPGNQPATSWFSTGYVAALVQDSVRLGGQSTAPLSGDFRQGTLSFRVVLDDTAWPWLTAFLMDSGRLPTGHIIADGALTAAGVSLELESGEGANFAAGDTVHLRRSSYRVASIAGDVLTLTNWRQLSDGSGSTTKTTGVAGDLGQFLTILADADGRGEWDVPPYDDDRVWTAPPYIRGREVLLCRSFAGVAGPETVWGWFVIESVDVDASGAEARVECRDVMEVLRERQFNELANVYTVDASRRTDGGDLLVSVSTADYRPEGGVWFRDTGIDRDVGVMQVGKTALTLTGSFRVGDFVAQTRWVGGGGLCDGTPVYRSEPGPEDPTQWAGKEKAWELLVSDPGVVADATDHPYWCEDPRQRGGVPAILSHPVDIVLAHLGIFATNLPETWRLDVPAWVVDVDGIVATRDTALGWVREWPGIVWGIEGKPLKALESLGNMLRSIGSDFCVSGFGALSIRSLFDPIDSGAIGMGRITYGRAGQRATDLVADVVTAKAGIGVSGKAAVTVRAEDAYRTTWYPYSETTIEVHADGLVHPDRAGSDVGWYYPLLRQLGQLYRCAPAVWKLGVTATSRVTPGEQYAFTVTGLRGVNGLVANRTFRGFVLRVDWDGSVAGAGQMTITVLDYGFTAYRIGPSGQVYAFTGGDTLECAPIQYIRDPVPYLYDGTTELDFDVEQFAEGDVCVVTDRRGVVKSDPFTVDTVSTAPYYLSATAAITSYTWANGDRVRLAQLSTAREPEIGYIEDATYGTG